MTDASNQPDPSMLLQRVSQGDEAAVSQLLPIVYADLRERAAGFFRAQPRNHTLQPTALVHEAYMRLVRNPGQGWESKAHFCAIASGIMRQILVSHARHRGVRQRDLAARQESATQINTPTGDASVDLLDLEDALQELGETEPASVRLVELRFFGGMSIEETAEALSLSTATVKRDWRRVRAWLLQRLRGASD